MLCNKATFFPFFARFSLKNVFRVGVGFIRCVGCWVYVQSRIFFRLFSVLCISLHRPDVASCVLTFYYSFFHIGSLFCKVDFQYRTIWREEKSEGRSRRMHWVQKTEGLGRVKGNGECWKHNEHCVIIEVMDGSRWLLEIKMVKGKKYLKVFSFIVRGRSENVMQIYVLPSELEHDILHRNLPYRICLHRGRQLRSC